VRSPLDVVAPARLGRPFRWILGWSWVTNLGDGFSIAAGPLLIVSLTHNPILVSLAAAMQWVPPMLLGLHVGAIADRVDRRTLIVRSNAVRAVSLAVLTALVFTKSVSVAAVLVVLFVLGTVDAFANSASAAVLPMLVAKPDLGVANARLTFGWASLNQLAGPPIGALLFVVGAAWPFCGQTICAVAGIVLFMRVVLPAHVPRPEPGRRLRHEIAEGIRWTRGSPAMRTLVVQIFTFNITYGASWSVLVLFSEQRLGLGSVGFGWLTAVGAVGSLVGTMTYGWLEAHVSLSDIMRYGLVLETVTHLVLAWTTSAAIAMFILLLFGIHIAYWATTASSVRQRAVPVELQGRVSSVYRLAMLGGLVIGSALGGVLANRWGITAPYWFGFVGSAVILAALWHQLGQVGHDDAQIRDAQ